MSTAITADGHAPAPRRDSGPAVSPRLTGPAAADVADKAATSVSLIADDADKREKFIPLTRQALMERLTRPHSWPAGQEQDARRFFRYLDYWRQQSYGAKLLDLEQSYEPFSPDSDLLITRKFADAEKMHLQRHLVDGVCQLLVQANYTRVDPKNISLIMTKESHYGLDLHVDMSAFDELAIYYRGATMRTGTRRNVKKLYLKKEEFQFPIFQRLCILFKLKPEEARIREIMAAARCERDEAEKIVKKARGEISDQIKPDFVYMKLFKNIPQTDIEMVFPNTKIRFRMFDKIKLGVTAGGGLGMGVVGTAGKIAVATNPIALAGAMLGLGGIAVRQGMNFMNQRNRYMVTMAQNLYFHSLGDNRGVMSQIAERAAEEDLKEEMLLYSVLAKERVNRRELKDVDQAIEQYLLNTFGLSLNFDLDDALTRLKRDGIVTERPDGALEALSPAMAAAHIDELWDQFLDDLPDQTRHEGVEFDIDDDNAEDPNAGVRDGAA